MCTQRSLPQWQHDIRQHTPHFTLHLEIQLVLYHLNHMYVYLADGVALALYLYWRF